MARLLSLPKRLAVFLFTIVFSLVQVVRPKPSGAATRAYREGQSGYSIKSALLFRLAKTERNGSGFFHRPYAFEPIGIFPFVRLVPLSASAPVPVPVLLGTATLASRPTPERGLLHAAIGGLSGPYNQSSDPKAYPEYSCVSCSTCSTCSTCQGCGGGGCSTCATCASCVSCIANCGTSCTGISCGTGFGSCGTNCGGCSSCASCLSCSSCTCNSCSSCQSCGSCSSCRG